MNWQSWPYGKRGLTSGLIVGVLFSVYMFADMERFFFRYPECSIGGPCPKLFYPELVILYVCFALIGGTTIGAMLGYTYGKLKTRKDVAG